MFSRATQWVPPPPSAEQVNLEEKISIDLGDEYEQALADATQEEIIDLAGKVKQNEKKNREKFLIQIHSPSTIFVFFRMTIIIIVLL